MAEVSSKDARYRSYATSGTSALELDWAAYRQELERAGELPRRERRASNGTRRRPADYASPARREQTYIPAPETRETERDVPEPRRSTAARSGRRVRTRRRTRPNPFTAAARSAASAWQWARRMPVLYLLGSAAAVLLAIQMLMSCIALTRLSSETVELQEELQTLRAENVVLNTEYERMFDLTTVEAAAVSAGMTKPARSQIVYVNLSGGDMAFVYREADPGFLGSVAKRVAERFAAVKEFFD